MVLHMACITLTHAVSILSDRSLCGKMFGMATITMMVCRRCFMHSKTPSRQWSSAPFGKVTLHHHCIVRWGLQVCPAFTRCIDITCVQCVQSRLVTGGMALASNMSTSAATASAVCGTRSKHLILMTAKTFDCQGCSVPATGGCQTSSTLMLTWTSAGRRMSAFINRC